MLNIPQCDRNYLLKNYIVKLSAFQNFLLLLWYYG